MTRTDASLPHRLILTIGGMKGGSGRSTFAVHAAVQAANNGLRTILIDADEQGCSTWFTERRATLYPALPRYTCVSRSAVATKNPRDLPSRVEQLTETYDRVIIDAGGAESAFQNALLQVTDILLVPVEPTPFEAIGLVRLEQAIGEARKVHSNLVVYAALNRAGMHGGVKNDREMATRLRASKELQYIDAPIRNDVAFRQAAEHGLAVNELKGSHRDAGAISDMARLLQMVQNPQLYAAQIGRLKKDRIAKAG